MDNTNALRVAFPHNQAEEESDVNFVGDYIRRQEEIEDGLAFHPIPPIKLVIPEDQAYFPTPMVTFLIDTVDKLRCQICQEVELRFPRENNSLEGITPPAITPCGHVACFPCLSGWIRERLDCPFCRKPMMHAACGHAVEPRIIAWETITRLPKTLIRGGTIGAECRPCLAERLKQIFWVQMGNAATSVMNTRRTIFDAHPAPRMYAEQVFQDLPRQYRAQVIEQQQW
ncbi:hypothetical protein M426DRAFT_16999 [Hypoxylon sp. CI-4A]|nr:hypothetical protein M426DRAFT_16999 [Hypoxylon sp. CI-4A]